MRRFGGVRSVARLWPLSGLILSLFALIQGLLLAREMQRLAPIVILDRNALIRAIPRDADSATRKAALDALSALENGLALEGYLVIDSQSVVAAPDDLYILKEPPHAP